MLWLLRLFLAVIVSWTLFWMTLTVLRSTGQVFYRIFLRWDLSDASFIISLEVWALGRKTQEVKSCIYF